MQAAKIYYDQQLMIKYGIIPFANLLVMARWSERQAVLLNRKWIQKHGLDKFRSKVNLSLLESQERESFHTKKADKFLTFKLKLLVLVALKKNTVDSKKEAQVHRAVVNRASMAAYLRSWKTALHYLKAEKVEQDAKETYIANNFRRILLGRHLIKALKENIAE